MHVSIWMGDKGATPRWMGPGPGHNWDIIRTAEMLEVIQLDFTKYPLTVEVQAFFILLKALKVSLHEHTKPDLWSLSLSIFFSNNCYNDLIKLISDIFSKPYKETKDMYQSKKIFSGIGMKYEKIDVYSDNCMLFWKDLAKKNKWLKCGKSRFIEIVIE
jgi:hypothetical protein